MVDDYKSKLFTQITERNALRRQAMLPLLDVRQAMDHGIRLEARRVFDKECEKHRGRLEAIAESVLIDLRKEHGPRFGSSSSGRFAVSVAARRVFLGYLAGIGIIEPAPIHPIIYGGSRGT